MSTSPSPDCSTATVGKPRRRRRWPLASLCLAALVAAGASLAYPLLASAYDERLARQALERQDLTEARAHLLRSLDRRPRRASAHFLLAQTLRRAGEFGPAR